MAILRSSSVPFYAELLAKESDAKDDSAPADGGRQRSATTGALMRVYRGACRGSTRGDLPRTR